MENSAWAVNYRCFDWEHSPCPWGQRTHECKQRLAVLSRGLQFMPTTTWSHSYTESIRFAVVAQEYLILAHFELDLVLIDLCRFPVLWSNPSTLWQCQLVTKSRFHASTFLYSFYQILCLNSRLALPSYGSHLPDRSLGSEVQYIKDVLLRWQFAWFDTHPTVSRFESLLPFFYIDFLNQ